jgi:uncharacterized membrane protein
MKNNSTMLTGYRIGELYLRGLLIVLVILLFWYLVDYVWGHLDNMVADTKTATAALILILLLPLPLGWIQKNVMRKAFDKSRPTRALGRMEDRLVAELAKDEGHGYSVVLVNHPSNEIRSLGLVTAMIAGKDDDTEFAAVFVPKGPGQGVRGKIHIINVKELEYTDWDLRMFLQHQLTHGSSSPGHLDKAAWLESRKSDSPDIA